VKTIIIAILIFNTILYSQIAFTVNTDEGWQSTGVNLVSGDHILIVSEGIWNNSNENISSLEDWRKPDGYSGGAATSLFLVPQLSRYSLVGKIGLNGAPFAVGSMYNTSVSTSGQLYLAVNDSRYDDNFGYLVSFITHNQLTEMKDNDKKYIADSYNISQNYPNPFNPVTNIDYQVPQAELVSINIYDISGRLIKILRNEWQNSGIHSVSWDGTNDNGTTVSSGNYFYQVKIGSNVATKKMILLK
jgi:hypothetical protein